MNSIQIALLGVVGTLLALQFKSGKSEYGIYVSLAVSLFLFLCMLSRLEIFVRTVKKIADYIKLDAGQMSILLKMAGVTYVAEFASGICKDAGYQNIAVQIEDSGCGISEEQQKALLFCVFIYGCDRMWQRVCSRAWYIGGKGNRRSFRDVGG